MYPSNNHLNANNYMGNQSQLNTSASHFNPAAAAASLAAMAQPAVNSAALPSGVLMENGREYLMMPGNDNTRWYMCNVCNLPCKDKKSLYYHQYVSHVANQTYRCPMCGEIFWTNDTLQLHLHEKHPNQCLFCHIQFATPTHLTNHIMLCHTEQGLRPFR